MLLAPLWFVALIIVAGFFTPGYSHLHQAISELAAPGAPWALLVRFGGFVPLGGAFLVFASRFKRLSDVGAFRFAAVMLFALTGLALIVAGIFPTDEFGRRNTPAGMIHAVAGLFLISVIVVTPWMAALRLRGQAALRLYSLFTGLALLALFILLPNGISLPLIRFQKSVLGGIFEVWYEFHGVCQRLLFLVYFVWLAVFVQLYGPLNGENVKAEG